MCVRVFDLIFIDDDLFYSFDILCLNNNNNKQQRNTFLLLRLIFSIFIWHHDFKSNAIHCLFVFQFAVMSANGGDIHIHLFPGQNSNEIFRTIYDLQLIGNDKRKMNNFFSSSFFLIFRCDTIVGGFLTNIKQHLSNSIDWPKSTHQKNSDSSVIRRWWEKQKTQAINNKRKNRCQITKKKKFCICVLQNDTLNFKENKIVTKN